MNKTTAVIVQLVHMQGPFKGEIQEYSEPEILIGRHSACHLIFPKDLSIISRKHATIVREGERFKIVDHSSNGTFLNGKEIKEAYLKDGDILDFSEGGPKVSFLTKTVEVSGEIAERLQSAPAKTQATPPQEREAPVNAWEQISSGPQPQVIPQSKPAFTPKAESRFSSTVEPAQISPAFPENVQIKKTAAPLIIQYGPTLNSFNELPVTLGKSQSCDIRIDHPSILDLHAQIFFSNNQYWIKDLTGKNLVTLNDMPVGIQSPLSPDNRLSLSPSGPGFLFLSGGRMAEIEAPFSGAGDPASSGGSEAGSGGITGKAPSPEKGTRDKAGKSAKSMFTKLWNR